MKIKSLITALILSTLPYNLAYATVIDLDATNPDHCRQQILSGSDNYPVVMAYAGHCPYAKKLMPIYEEMAKAHPERNFFRLDKEQDSQGLVKALCLQQIAHLGSPTLIIFKNQKAVETDKNSIVGPVRMGADEITTKEDLEKFINMG